MARSPAGTAGRLVNRPPPIETRPRSLALLGMTNADDDNRRRGALRLGYLISGWPGDRMASLCSLAVMRVLSASVFAAARRLRNWTIFSLRVRRRRISGRRLGADMNPPETNLPDL